MTARILRGKWRWRASVLALALILDPGLVPSLADEISVENARDGGRAVIEVDRVEVTGISVFSDQAVDAVMEVRPGDKLDRQKIVRSAESIQKLYRVHGYEQISIQTRLYREKKRGPRGYEDVVEFGISEGLPTRLARVSFVPVGVDEEQRRRLWKVLEPKLAPVLGLAAGEIFDQERLATGRRGLQEALASREFVGARVEEVRVFVAPLPEKPIASAGKWVDLELRISLGDRVSFGFRGNEVVATNRLTALVDEQRLVGFGQDYVGAIRNRIEEEYRSLGYAQVTVEPYTFQKTAGSDRHVTYRIHEGPRVRIESVDFDGNQVFSNEELREEFFRVASPFVRQGWFIEKDVNHSAELVVEWMKSRGFLSAKLVTVKAAYPPPTERTRPTAGERRVKLVVYVYEWDQTLVQEVRLTGVTVFSAAETREMLGVREGDPLNLFAFNEGIERLKASYRARGYLGMKVLHEGTDLVVHYSQESRVAEIDFQVSEGPCFRVSRIEIEGLGLTRDKVVRRELLLQEGDPLEEARIIESEAALRKLGIFSAVAIRSMDDPLREDHKILKVTLQEAAPGVIAGGAGYRNDLGLRVFGEVGYTNLSGSDHTVSLAGSVNRRLDETRFVEYQGQIGYVWPWFAGDPVTFRPSFSVDQKKYINFEARTVSLATTWERRLLKRVNLAGSLSYSLEQAYQTQAINTEENGQFRIGAITPSFKLDLRDNPLAPTRGFFATTSFEWADPALFSQGEEMADGSPNPIGYARFLLRADYHLPLSDLISWYFSFRTGIEKSTQSIPGDDVRGAIPLVKQFTLGGVGSLRGYREQELNHQDQRLLGTASFVNYRTQLQLPVSGALKFAPFVDAGNLQINTYSLGRLRYGTGFGLHYLTPVGPVNFDVGFKVNPQGTEDRVRFYFSIGVI